MDIRCGTLHRIILTLLLLGSTVVDDLPTITLATVMPPGGKIGTDVEITINGSELEEANALLFSHPGISAKLKAEKQFVVTIAADVPPGIYDLRLIGKSGVSNPRSFAVGELPELVEKAANDKPEAAAELAVGSVINAPSPPRLRSISSSSQSKVSAFSSNAPPRRSTRVSTPCSPCSIQTVASSSPAGAAA